MQKDLMIYEIEERIHRIERQIVGLHKRLYMDKEVLRILQPNPQKRVVKLEQMSLFGT